MEIWLRVDNKKGKLKVGTPVHASIVGRQVPQALTVPSSALLTAQDGSTSVMVVGADGAAHSKPVTAGITDDGRVQITSGLTTADMVITSATTRFEDGTKVKVGAAGDANDDAKKPSRGQGWDDK